MDRKVDGDKVATFGLGGEGSLTVGRSRMGSTWSFRLVGKRPFASKDGALSSPVPFPLERVDRTALDEGTGS